MKEKMDKATRILDIYVRLCEGKVINKKTKPKNSKKFTRIDLKKEF